MNTHHRNTLAAIVTTVLRRNGIVPSPKGGKATVAVLEYRLSERPLPINTCAKGRTSSNFIWREVEISDEERKARGDEIRVELFARSHACMRASPLTKSYGWGAHYDEDGRLAIYPRECARRISHACRKRLGI